MAECHFEEHEIQDAREKVERITFFSTIGKNSTAPLNRKEGGERFSKEILGK